MKNPYWLIFEAVIVTDRRGRENASGALLLLNIFIISVQPFSDKTYPRNDVSFLLF